MAIPAIHDATTMTTVIVVWLVEEELEELAAEGEAESEAAGTLVLVTVWYSVAGLTLVATGTGVGTEGGDDEDDEEDDVDEEGGGGGEDDEEDEDDDVEEELTELEDTVELEVEKLNKGPRLRGSDDVVEVDVSEVEVVAGGVDVLG